MKEQLEKDWSFNAAHLNNFEIQKYYQNKPRFNGVNSENDLSKMKDAAYILNLDAYNSVKSFVF